MPPLNQSHGRSALLQTLRSSALGLASIACGVIATKKTTVTQQVKLAMRPIKCQSRLWSQRGTKVNGSHHGDNSLLGPTGIQVATKSYATLQAMTPTNVKTVHQTSLLDIESNLDDSDCCRLPTTSVLSNKADKLRSNQF